MIKISYELFPPKTSEGFEKLLSVISTFAETKPAFFSCTYGAGGGSRDKTLDIVELIQHKHHIPTVAHLTCVLHTKDEIKDILNIMKQRGINRVLALRGDPPKDNPHWKPGPTNFQYASDLVSFIRANFGNYFNIGVAGFPEGHLLMPDREKDADILKKKVDAGADFVITQLFFNNQDYFDYVARLKKRGVNVPIIPGILPITDYQALIRFCSLCAASIPDEVHQTFKPIDGNSEATYNAGIDFAIHQCKDLIAHGVSNLHFYTLNKIEPTLSIIKHL